jgi:predicted alpha/beta-fold hydrolase
MKQATGALLATAFLSASGLFAEQQPAVPQEGFFDSNGVRIRYLDHDQGPAVVLIHGYTGNADRHWINNGIFANLAKDYRVIALDCRGHGKSGKPADPKAYGAEMGQDIVRTTVPLPFEAGMSAPTASGFSCCDPFHQRTSRSRWCTSC